MKNSICRLEGLVSLGLVLFGMMSAVKAEVLTVSANTTINADAAYDGIVFTTTANITGTGRLTLGSAGIQVLAGTAKINNPIEFVGETEQSITVAKDGGNGKLYLNGVLSGAAPLKVDGDGITVFVGANTFTGELTLTGGGKIYARNDFAFGSPEAKTILRSNATDGRTQVYFDNVDISEPFDTYFDEDATKQLIFEADKTSVLRGDFTRQSGRTHFQFRDNSTVVLSNRFNLSYSSSVGTATSRVEFWKPVETCRFSFNYGTYHFHSAMNVTTWTYAICPSYGGVLKMFTNDVFCVENDPLRAADGALLRMSHAGCVFDLNGYDQTLLSISEECLGTITSESPACLTLVGRPKYDLAATSGVTFSGQVGLALNCRPTAKSLALTLTGISTATGPLAVSNNSALAFGPSAKWGSANVTVSGSGATFTLANKDALPGGDGVVTVADGGSIALNYSGSTVIAKLIDGETEYTQAGLYGAIDNAVADYRLSSITGTGTFTILPSADGATFTWAASPDATDVSVSKAANWQENTVPDFAKGTDKAVFAAEGAGGEAVVDTAATFAGIAFVRSAGESFRLSSTESGSLTLGVDGLAISEPAADADVRTFTNAVPSTLAYSQPWTIPGTNTVYWQTAPLSAGEHVTVEVSGNGMLRLAADNSDFHGTVQVDVPEVGTGCDIAVDHPNALAHANINVVSAQSVAGITQQRILFPISSQSVLGGNIDIQSNGKDAYNSFVFGRDSQTMFNGMVRLQSYDRSSFGNGCRVVYAGGYQSTGIRGSLTSSTLVYTNTPATIGHLSLTTYTTLPSTVEIWTSRNIFNNPIYGLDLGGNVVFDCHAPFAVVTNMMNNGRYCAPRFYYGYNGGRRPELRLNGFDQSVASVSQNGSDTTGPAAKVSSETAAQLHVYQSAAGVSQMLAFEGGAGLTLSGPETLELLHTPNSSTGRLEVVGGHLALGASWTNAAEVVVRENGVMTLQTGNLFGRKATTLRLESGSTFDLGGTDQTVAMLEVDGVRIPRGTYRTGEAALKGIVTGAGSLTVYGTEHGLQIIFR